MENKRESKYTRQEVNRLYKRFHKLDKNKDGYIEKEDFLQVPEIASNPLFSRVIKVLENEGKIDFEGFLNGLATFSKNGNKEKRMRLLFSIYDVDGDSYISNGELFVVLKAMASTNLENEQLQQVVDKTIQQANKDGTGKISFNEFNNLVTKTNVWKEINLTGL